MSGDQEVQEDALCRAIRELKSFHMLLCFLFPAMQESIGLDLKVVAGRNGVCVLDLAMIIWEENAWLAGKKKRFLL